MSDDGDNVRRFERPEQCNLKEDSIAQRATTESRVRHKAKGLLHRTNLDRGFHTFSDGGRAKFAKSLSGVLRPGGVYFMLCFSDREPTGWGGPRRVSKEEIRKTFADGWRVDYIRAAKFETIFHQRGGEAWLSRVTKL